MAGVRRFEDLVTWQLAEQVKAKVFALTAGERVRRDARFCTQIQESARSVSANLAEGFGSYDPRPNARYVSIAKASLEETRNHTYEGFHRGHFSQTDRDELLRLITRASIATTRLLRYLRSCKEAPPGKSHARRKPEEPGT